MTFIEITLPHGFSPENLQRIFRTPDLKNTSGGLLLNYNDVVILEDQFFPTIKSN